MWLILSLLTVSHGAMLHQFNVMVDVAVLARVCLVNDLEDFCSFDAKIFTFALLRTNFSNLA